MILKYSDLRHFIEKTIAKQKRQLPFTFDFFKKNMQEDTDISQIPLENYHYIKYIPNTANICIPLILLKLTYEGVENYLRNRTGASLCKSLPVGLF